MIRDEENLQQLFIALTSRWRKESGALAIGITRAKLLKAGAMSEEELDEMLKNLRIKAAVLGLEVVEYLFEGDIWYAMRSIYVCPTELSSKEEALMAVIIASIEMAKKKETSMELLKKKLVSGKYFTDYQLERLVKKLEQLGYVRRKNKKISYSPRTMLEFPEEARKHIAEETPRFVF